MKWILLLALIPAATLAETLTLTWDPPDTTDEIKEYRLYDKGKLIKIIPAPTIRAQVFTSPGKAYAWEVTAIYKKDLAQSGPSNSVLWQPTPVPILVWPPSAPSNLVQGK